MKKKLYEERLRNSTKRMEEERRLINEEFLSMKKAEKQEIAQVKRSNTNALKRSLHEI